MEIIIFFVELNFKLTNFASQFHALLIFLIFIVQFKYTKISIDHIQ